MGGNSDPDIESTLCIQVGSEFYIGIREKLSGIFHGVKKKVFKLGDGSD